MKTLSDEKFFHHQKTVINCSITKSNFETQVKTHVEEEEDDDDQFKSFYN